MIKVNIEASQTQSSLSIDLDDLGINKSDWDEMSEDKKEEQIRNYVLDMNDQPYWVLDKFEEDKQ